MHRPTIVRFALPVLALALTACEPGSDPDTAAPAAAPAPAPAASSASSATGTSITGSLEALPGKEGVVPELTRTETVVMQTTAGDLTIEIYPEAAPNAAQRFIELVESGFYDGTPVSRVVPGFVAQFGVNWRDPHKDWQDRHFDDDPTLFALERGTLAFAKAGPDTNSTQVFINYGENNRLADPQYNFTVFGKVVSGMEVVDRFVQVGDPNGGLDQGRLWNDGAAYLDSLELQPTMIERAVVL